MSIRATLSATPPADVDPTKLRGTLVWTNGLGLESLVTLDCNATTSEGLRECARELRGQIQVSTADVEIEMGFPLQVRIDMYELPAPIRGKLEGTAQRLGSLEPGVYHSVPEAEVVVYEDKNGNGRLDLLPLGQPGPGPDRVVALSSGRDSEGVARRTIIAYKAGRIMPTGPYMPLLPDLTREPDAMTPGDRIEQDGPNGVYALRYKARKGYVFEEDAMLKGEPLGDSMTLAWLYEDTFEAITPLADTTIPLYAVEPARRSWLARGCERMRSDHPYPPEAAPPAGADVQCGAGMFAHASHPDDYCGQQAGFAESLFVDRGLPVPAWWPCDERGLKSGSPYRPATHRLDAELLDGERLFALAPPYGETHDVRCQPGVFYHFDHFAAFRMPTVAPPPGSQVLCRSSDSLAYVPPATDGCQYQLEYDLAFQPVLGTHAGVKGWDLRDQRPSWWPCDAAGHLKSGTPYVAPDASAPGSCEPQNPRVQSAWMVTLRPGVPVRCVSSEQLVYRRDWVGPCESDEQLLAISYADEDIGFSSSTVPAWWPCDAEGKLRPDTPFVSF